MNVFLNYGLKGKYGLMGRGKGGKNKHDLESLILFIGGIIYGYPDSTRF